MHAKAAIADRSAALVTSANLTGHALDLNMELGLLVRGGSVPARLADHFNALFASGELVEIQPG
jgi:phosphatidylserine/phosphatidylglycerophosphate/cardiolipin synthase-like enzyme